VTAAKPAGESICIGCGLCCDGTLHATATVQPPDEARVTAAGLEIGEERGRRFFRQPCPHFSHGSCSIYSARPGVCRTYRCALLENLEAGKIGESDAREKIATAKGLVAAVRKIDADAVTPPQRTALAARLNAELRELDGAERERAAKALLQIAMLEYLLNQHFLKKKDQSAAAEPANNAA